MQKRLELSNGNFIDYTSTSVFDCNSYHGAISFKYFSGQYGQKIFSYNTAQNLPCSKSYKSRLATGDFMELTGKNAVVGEGIQRSSGSDYKIFQKAYFLNVKGELIATVSINKNYQGLPSSSLYYGTSLYESLISKVNENLVALGGGILKFNEDSCRFRYHFKIYDKGGGYKSTLEMDEMYTGLLSGSSYATRISEANFIEFNGAAVVGAGVQRYSNQQYYRIMLDAYFLDTNGTPIKSVSVRKQFTDVPKLSAYHAVLYDGLITEINKNIVALGGGVVFATSECRFLYYFQIYDRCTNKKLTINIDKYRNNLPDESFFRTDIDTLTFEDRDNTNLIVNYGLKRTFWRSGKIIDVHFSDSFKYNNAPQINSFDIELGSNIQDVDLSSYVHDKDDSVRSLKVKLITVPSKGVLVSSDSSQVVTGKEYSLNTLKYRMNVSAKDYSSDSFKYTVIDCVGASGVPATVSLNIDKTKCLKYKVPYHNTSPQASSFGIKLDSNVQDIDFSSHVSDENDSTSLLKIKFLIAPSYGTLILSDGNSVIVGEEYSLNTLKYRMDVSAKDYSSDSFKYTVIDCVGASGVPATVNIIADYDRCFKNEYVIAKLASESHDGGDGIDTLSYNSSSVGVLLNIKKGIGSKGYAEGDTIKGFEIFEGSAFKDIIIVDNNTLKVTAGAGNDTVVVDNLHTIVDGGSGEDELIIDTPPIGLVCDFEEGSCKFHD